MPLIDLIAGARPNFVKVAALVQALDRHRDSGGGLRYRVVHTGQHYDVAMSGDFFSQLGIPPPAINLGAGSGSQAEQTGAIMVGYEKLLMASPCDLCLVVGDVNSTLACAITARKMATPVAHVEAGIRSGDWRMPEEINRRVTDSISDWCFTTTPMASENLRRTGIEADRIFFVGNTMIDTLLTQMDRLRPPSFWLDENLHAKGYFVLTLHRPVNVDDPCRLAAWLRAVGEATRGMPVIFPLHPRVEKRLAEAGPLPDHLRPVPAQAYLEFNYLVRHAKAVITDSGGITEETTVMGVPCMTLRDSTERPETVLVGTNELIGSQPEALAPALDRLFQGNWKRGAVPELWDGQAADRIVSVLARLLAPNDLQPGAIQPALAGAGTLEGAGH
ncbi:MAG: non-hydrolyzing UDP-N-acetylglucosamine 2-epimerase [Pseudomonadota bacterium]